ncbi:MAG: ammonium transporter [Desulfobulbaceae bacterium]|nr:ammonium transporter [Desulfobulbaceae bacterium]
MTLTINSPTTQRRDNTMNTSDIAFMLIATAMVMLMTPGLPFFTTQVAAGAGALSWMFAEWIVQRKPTILGAASGAVAGLVAITPGGANGLFFGNAHQFTIQAIGAGATIVYSIILTYIILKVVDLIVGLRVSRDEEIQGLDITQHSEEGYSF